MVKDLPSVIICDDVAKDPSDCLSLLTSAKSYFSESRYSARYFPANIPWPMTERAPSGIPDVMSFVQKKNKSALHGLIQKNDRDYLNTTALKSQ